MAVLANERIRLGRRATRRQGAALLSYTFDMAAQFNFFDQQRSACGAVFGALIRKARRILVRQFRSAC